MLAYVIKFMVTRDGKKWINNVILFQIINELHKQNIFNLSINIFLKINIQSINKNNI